MGQARGSMVLIPTGRSALVPLHMGQQQLSRPARLTLPESITCAPPAHPCISSLILGLARGNKFRWCRLGEGMAGFGTEDSASRGHRSPKFGAASGSPCVFRPDMGGVWGRGKSRAPWGWSGTKERKDRSFPCHSWTGLSPHCFPPHPASPTLESMGDVRLGMQASGS